MFHCGSSFNLEAKLSLNALAGTTAVILVSKKKKKASCQYIDSFKYIWMAQYTQKRHVNNTVYLLLRPTIFLFT